MTSPVPEPGDNAVPPADDLDSAPANHDHDHDDRQDTSGQADQDDTDPDTAPDDDDAGEVDRESVEVVTPVAGPPVDPPDSTVPAASLARAQFCRPIVPGWARSRADARSAAKWAARYAGYVLAYHATRTPKYAARLLAWATVGLLRTPGRVTHWATAEEGNWALRQAAANRGDAETWLRLDRQRQRQASWRWPLLLTLTLALTVAALVLAYGPVPAWWRWAAATLAVAVLARRGRPADRPITDRVTEGRRYRKLTAEAVRRALTSLSLAGINQAVAKDPSALTFPQEIGRDGPGYRAVVDLPYGVDAAEVVARRAKIASGLRLPVDQVWPQPGGGHAGRLELWVGDEPASKMRQPAWPLLREGKVDVFKPFPFATTPRLSTVTAGITARNWLFGGVPGSGKTFAMRLIVLAAALDVRVELRGYELKGTGDYDMVEALCAEYGSGADDDTALRALGMIKWLYGECQRRGPVVKAMAKAGKAPENKVTPELASTKGLGLHPIVAFIDEAQELFGHSVKAIREEAGDLAVKTIKLGRALGITMVLGTQRPDKDSLPTAVTANTNTRFCLSVMDQTANDMILGTSAYKNGYRATQFQPVEDAGWGWAVGLGRPAPIHSYEVDGEAARRVADRALKLRQAAGTLPRIPQPRQAGPGFDLLADLVAVWPAGEDKAWNETLLDRLAELRPDAYAGWKAEQLTSALKPHSIDVGQVGRRVDGKTVNRRGPARADIDTAIAERNRRARVD